jgi:hypothetical protein
MTNMKALLNVTSKTLCSSLTKKVQIMRANEV